MLSKTNEYALRVVTYLGENTQQSATNATIAEMTGVPGGYLYKILRTLERAGLVRAQRGKHGGYCLGRPAATISVLDVVTAVDPLPRIHACPLNLKEHAFGLCPLHRRLDEVAEQIEKTFRTSTIAELASNPPPPPGALPGNAVENSTNGL